MTVSLIATYSVPEGRAYFDDYFRDVHMPLVLAIPGLTSVRIHRIDRHLMGTDKPYMIVEMAFPDRATFDKAMASDENRAAGRDAVAFAKGIVSLMVSEAETLPQAEG